MDEPPSNIHKDGCGTSRRQLGSFYFSCKLSKSLPKVGFWNRLDREKREKWPDHLVSELHAMGQATPLNGGK